MRFLALWLTSAVICLSVDHRAVVHSQADPRPGGSTASATASAADRLHVAVLFLTDDILKASLREDARVERICKNASDVAACTTRERRSLTLHFVRVRTAPSLSAPIAGDLLLLIGRRPDTELPALVYRAATDSRLWPWTRGIDWGYGPHLSGVRSRDGWIGLSGAPFDGDVWIYGGGQKDLRGEATSIAGEVLDLHDVRARRADGRTFVLPSGSYFITHVDRAGVVTFREELDIDMPCGEEVTPPTVMPPTFRAPASAFFDARGRPRFAVKYTKGC
jgi:hypothetical protein